MIRLEGAGKRFGERWALRDVSVAVEKGAMLLVTGPNGSGKSTLLRLMAGLARADEGTVACAAPPGGIGYAGHAPLVYPGLTALENLAFWRSLHGRGCSGKTLLDALAGVGLEAFADEAAGTFSRGMAQRLSLARLLLLRPSLVLLDEPLAGLDAASAARMRGLFAGLKAGGAALVWASHDPAHDMAGADAVLLLEETSEKTARQNGIEEDRWFGDMPQQGGHKS
jgi:heme exporter protein A